MPWLTALIGLAFLSALAGVYVFISRPVAVRALLGSDESFQVTYEFLLVTVLGGAVALLYKQLDQRREQRRDLRQMYSELLGAFNGAKTVRRRLRARLGTAASIDPNATIAAEEYERQVELLNDAQLTFEMYAKRAEQRSLWFRQGRRLAKPLRQVEGYLSSIVKEYERELATFGGVPPAKKISQLGNLCEFIGPYKDAHQFKARFKYPMRDALAALGNIMLR